MKLFNAIQLAVLNISSPIWLNLLREATFPFAVAAFCLGVFVALVAFIWSIIGFADTIDKF